VYPARSCKSVAHYLGAGPPSILHIRRPVRFASNSLAFITRPPWYTPGIWPRKKTTLESLAKLISESSASADKKFAALAEDIADIKSTMATKADLAEAVEKLDNRLTAVESKIGGIHNRIDDEALKRGNLETRVRFNGNLVDCCNSATGARCCPEGGPDWTQGAYFFQSGPSPPPINTICKSYARMLLANISFFYPCIQCAF
jgi:hypothetical protein